MNEINPLMLLQYVAVMFGVYIVPYYCASLMFARKYTLRKRFLWLRIPAVVLGLAAALVLFNLASSAVPDADAKFAINRIMYISLFFLQFLSLKLLFSDGTANILFLSVMGYAIQNLTSKFCRAVLILAGQYESVSSELWLFVLVNLAFCVGVYSVFYALYARKFNGKSSFVIYNGELLAILVATLLISTIIGAFSDRYMNESRSLYLITCAFSMVANFLVAAFLMKIFEKKEYMRNAEIIQQVWLQDKKLYAAVRKNMDAMNIKMHDLKRQVRDICRVNNISTDVIKALEENISLFDKSIQTDNEALDVILNEKNLICMKEKIRFTCMMDGKPLSEVSPEDLYCIFGNALDNAIEAALKVSDEDRKTIIMSSRRSGSLFMINIDNYFDGEIEFEGNTIRSSKKDGEGHGYGIRSIKAAMEKYGGSASVTAENGVFRLMLLFGSDGRA